MSPKLLGLSLALSLLILPGCTAIEGLFLSEDERLEREIELERKKQELDRLRNVGKPSPAPTPVASATPAGPGNQSPQIKVLDSVLATTSRNNDTVRLIVSASDPDGDAIEYLWTSLYAGLSSTKGERVSWFPGADLKGKTNIITVSVSDKKGGTSTASLNVLVQADGTLLVREDTANLPVLNSLLATRSDDGRVLLRANATDPAGGLLRYQWTASAGQLSSPAAAASIWQANGAVGPVDLNLTVSNSSGLQVQGSFRFERRADGQLIGGFTGTDLQIPSGGIELPTGPGGDLQVLGDLLVLEEQTLVRIDPRTRTRSTLLNASDLPKAEDASSQSIVELVYAGGQAYLIVNEYRRLQGATWVLYRLSPSGGSPRRVGSLQDQSILDNGLRLSYQPGGGVDYQGQPRLLARLNAPSNLSPLRDQEGTWILGFDGDAEARVPVGLKVLAVSPKGELLCSKGYGTQDYQILLFDPESGDQRKLSDLKSLALQFEPDQFTFSHKGDKVAFVVGGGGNRGTMSIYSLDLTGRLKSVWENPKQATVKNLRFSLDDLKLSFVSYAYAYQESAYSPLNRTGYLSFVDIDGGEPAATKLDFNERTQTTIEWTP